MTVLSWSGTDLPFAAVGQTLRLSLRWVKYWKLSALRKALAGMPIAGPHIGSSDDVR